MSLWRAPHNRQHGLAAVRSVSTDHDGSNRAHAISASTPIVRVERPCPLSLYRAECMPFPRSTRNKPTVGLNTRLRSCAWSTTTTTTSSLSIASSSRATIPMTQARHDITCYTPRTRLVYPPDGPQRLAPSPPRPHASSPAWKHVTHTRTTS